MTFLEDFVDCDKSFEGLDLVGENRLSVACC